MPQFSEETYNLAQQRFAATAAQARSTRRTPGVTFNPGYWLSANGLREIQNEQTRPISERLSDQQQIDAASGALSGSNAGPAPTVQPRGVQVNPFVTGSEETSRVQPNNPFYQETANPEEHVQALQGALQGTTPESQAFSSAINPHKRARAVKAAKKLASLGVILKDGTPQDVIDAQMQFQREFPEFPAQVVPLTEEQARKLEQDIRNAQQQASSNRFARDLGLPPIPLAPDQQGNYDVAAGTNQAIAMFNAKMSRDASQNGKQQSALQSFYRSKSQVHMQRKPVKPNDFAFNPDSQATFNGQMEVWLQEFEDLQQEATAAGAFGAAPVGAGPTAAPPAQPRGLNEVESRFVGAVSGFKKGFTGGRDPELKYDPKTDLPIVTTAEAWERIKTRSGLAFIDENGETRQVP